MSGAGSAHQARVLHHMYETCETPAEHAERITRLEELATRMYEDMGGVLERSTDTVWAYDIATLRDCMDGHMEHMAALGIPPRDYAARMRELGMEA